MSMPSADRARTHEREADEGDERQAAQAGRGRPGGSAEGQHAEIP